jgi:ATP-binding cassette subfamily B protein
MTMTGLSNVQVTVMTALVSFERVFEVLDLPPMIRDASESRPIPGVRRGFLSIMYRFATQRRRKYAGIARIHMPPAKKIPEKNGCLNDITVRTPNRANLSHWSARPAGARQPSLTWLHGSMTSRAARWRSTASDVRTRGNWTLCEQARPETVIAGFATFSMTPIRANSFYAKPQPAESELTEGLRAAQIIWPLVSSLPKGSTRWFGDRGYRSPGVRGRCSAWHCRLLLKAPEIVILDEATATSGFRIGRPRSRSF